MRNQQFKTNFKFKPMQRPRYYLQVMRRRLVRCCPMDDSILHHRWVSTLSLGHPRLLHRPLHISRLLASQRLV
jgi:hypothetical protein